MPHLITRYIVCVVVLCALLMPAFSQSINPEFKHLGIQNGLSQSWAKCFLQDRKGYLWIGTADGLNRFNGTAFKTYKYQSALANSINHNNINAIYEDSKGGLWVGTQAGLNFYKRDVDEFVSCPSINIYVTSIFELRNNTLLLGTAGGLFLFDMTTHKATQLYNNFYVEKIIRDRRGNVWLASHRGLMLFNSGDSTASTLRLDAHQDHFLYGGLLKTIFEDSHGGIWIASSTNGLFHLEYPHDDITQARITHIKPGFTDDNTLTPGTICSLAEDEDQNLWVGIENGGINILNLHEFRTGNQSFSKVTHNPADLSSLTNNSVHALYADTQNTMWVGTYAGGANYFNKLSQRFGHHRSIPGSGKTISNKHVNVLLEEEKNLWIGTENGLNRYDKAKQRWEYFYHDFKKPRSLGSNAVITMKRDRNSRLWIATWNGGLNIFDEAAKTFSHFQHDGDSLAALRTHNVSAILETRDGHLWFGTIGRGIVVFHPESGSLNYISRKFMENSISSNWIVDLLEDHQGNIWISSTEAVDVFTRATGKFTSFTHDPSRSGSIQYNGATCLFEDSRHNIWLGTSNGLHYFLAKDSSFHHYAEADGLPSSSIKAITEDADGNIWFSTSNTITMLRDGTSLPREPEFKSFLIFSGQESSEFDSRSVHRNARGELYFGSTNGFFVFDPSNIRFNSLVPEIVFTDLRVNNVPIHISTPGSPLKHDIGSTTRLELSRKENVFTIGFAALNFIEQQNNQYAFKLEGFDKQWNNVGNQQSATYTNLDPGTYRFKVRASNNDGLWNEEGATLEIVILPAWWETSYAKAAYFVIFLLAVFFFRKHTIISVNLKNKLWRDHLEKQKSEELNEMKQQFFTHVSHEIRTPLTLILGPLGKLVKEENHYPELNTIFRNSTRLKVLVDQFLDFGRIQSQLMTVTPVRAEIIDVTRSIITNFIDYAGQRNIEMRFETNLSRCVAPIDLDKFEKILTNLLFNAVKSISGNGTVMTSLDFGAKEQLIIRIKDTGRGMTDDETQHIFEQYYSLQTHNGTGIGLYLVRKLIELQKGTITVESAPGKGTTFTVALPIDILEQGIGHDSALLHTGKPATGTTTNNEKETQRFNHTVLIVEDNVDMCDYLEGILSAQFRVVKENNPQCFIEQLIQHLPDLVISDVMMPEMDGFRLCNLIKNDIRFSHIPVVLLTAKAAKNDHISGYENGADDYIYKPFDPDILIARVRNLILRTQHLKQHFIGHDGIIDRSLHANPLDVKFMEDVLAEIKNNYTDPGFNVNEIISRMGMSRSLFYKKFKSLSDQSVNDLIKTFRLKKAAMLLPGNHFTVSEVAYECGFTDPAYFSRVFKECYGMTPKEFSGDRASA